MVISMAISASNDPTSSHFNVCSLWKRIIHLVLFCLFVWIFIFLAGGFGDPLLTHCLHWETKKPVYREGGSSVGENSCTVIAWRGSLTKRPLLICKCQCLEVFSGSAKLLRGEPSSLSPWVWEVERGWEDIHWPTFPESPQGDEDPNKQTETRSTNTEKLTKLMVSNN